MKKKKNKTEIEVSWSKEKIKNIKSILEIVILVLQGVVVVMKNMKQKIKTKKK